MQSKMLIKEFRIYFENKLATNTQLSFRISTNTNTFLSLYNLSWIPFCKLWQATDKICIDLTTAQNLKIQILKAKGLSLYKLLAQGKIQVKNLPQVLCKELKIIILVSEHLGEGDGLAILQSLTRLKKIQKKKHYLNMHKLTTTFLDMRDEDCNINVYLNSSLIFIKQIHLRMRKRTLFPNLKQAVKKSDLLILQIDSKRQKGTSNFFLIDHLQSGETAILTAWIRNKLGNKMGEFEIEYFLQNFYLSNRQLMFSAKQIQKMPDISIDKALATKQMQHLRLAINIESFLNADSFDDIKHNKTLLHKVIKGEKKRCKNLLLLPIFRVSKVKKKKSLEMEQILQEFIA